MHERQKQSADNSNKFEIPKFDQVEYFCNFIINAINSGFFSKHEIDLFYKSLSEGAIYTLNWLIPINIDKKDPILHQDEQRFQIATLASYLIEGNNKGDSFYFDFIKSEAQQARRMELGLPVVHVIDFTVFQEYINSIKITAKFLKIALIINGCDKDYIDLATINYFYSLLPIDILKYLMDSRLIVITYETLKSYKLSIVAIAKSFINIDYLKTDQFTKSNPQTDNRREFVFYNLLKLSDVVYYDNLLFNLNTMDVSELRLDLFYQKIGQERWKLLDMLIPHNLNMVDIKERQIAQIRDFIRYIKSAKINNDPYFMALLDGENTTNISDRRIAAGIEKNFKVNIRDINYIINCFCFL